MNESLPTVKELENLPLRAIAAYSARMAIRHSIELRGSVSSDLVDSVTKHLDSIWRSVELEDADLPSLHYDVADLYQAFSTMPSQSVVGSVIVCISRASSVATNLVFAVLNPAGIERRWRNAAKQAEKAGRAIESLPHGSSEAIASACRDYEVLLDTYGIHEQAIIGDPVDCFAD